MTNKEIEKRLDALENRILPEELPSMWVYLFDRSKEHMPVKGWKCGVQVFMREPWETDRALRDRVLSLTEKYKNPPNGQLFLSVI